MNSRSGLTFALLLAAAAASGAGCHRNIVAAEPPSVASPPIIEPLPTPEPPAASAAESSPTPVPEPGTVPLPPVNISPGTEPARPRPVPSEAEAPKPKPDAPAPAIAPELSPRQQAQAMRATNDDIRVSQRNLQIASGRRLNSSQKDLVDKIQGFLSQTQDAIRSDDWVRAQNLAHKAQVLSVELTRSF